VALLAVASLLLAACAGSDDPTASTRDEPPAAETPEGDSPNSTTAAPAEALPLFDAACAGELSVRTTATLPEHLTSVSGLAASRRHPGVIWAIEDSFEPPVITALDLDGQVRAEVRVEGSLFTNIDWEDLAVGPGPDGTPWLHVADIGDNLGIRQDVRVYRFPEPALEDATIEPEAVDLRHEEGRPNAEALLVDGAGAMWVIDKEPDGPATILRADEDGVLRGAGQLDLPGEQVTAVDLSADGRVVALRTADRLRLYRVEDGADLTEVLAGDGCTTPPLEERQGESAAFLLDGSGVVTVSEDESGQPVELHLTSR
jgi:hypothetical protein